MNTRRFGAAYTLDEFRAAQKKFEGAYARILDLIEGIRQNLRSKFGDAYKEEDLDKVFKTFPDKISWFNGVTATHFAALINSGVILTQGSMMLLEIPKKYVKSLELATRTVIGVRRIPNNVWMWLKRNQKHLEFIKHQVLAFVPKQAEDGDATFRVGPLTVHNALGLDSDTLEPIRKALDQAIRGVKRSNVPGFEKVLYGDIVLVGQVLDSDTLAHYNPREDVVYLRHVPKYDNDLVANLIHEFGHRYWTKFMPPKVQRGWKKYHGSVKNPKITLPQIGDVLPFKLGGESSYRTIYGITSDRYYLSPTEYLPADQLWDVLVKLSKRSFPSAYSRKNAEEHFCEAVSFEARGALAKSNLEALYSVFEMPKAASLIQRVAAQHFETIKFSK